jgi:HAD superfamily hydrolase (TIGR01509 family)
MAIKAVIFDLDGTLTEPYFDFDKIRVEMGLAPDAGPVWELMSKMTPDQRAAAEKILHKHETQAVEDSTLNPGAKETLCQLKQDGIKIGILTRNLSANANAVAKKHNLDFDMVVGREDGPVKPDGFGVRHICKTFSVLPTEALVVGDYLFDLLCAKDAGAKSVLLMNQENADEFAEHADFCIEKIDQILEIIDNQN